MAVRLIRENSEALFLEEIDNYGKQELPVGALLCNFSLSPQTVQSDAILSAVGDAIADHHGEVYLFSNRDVMIVWRGAVAPISSTLRAQIKSHFRGVITQAGEKNFYEFYDMRKQAGVVRSMFRVRYMGIEPAPAPAAQKSSAEPAVIDFSGEQLESLKRGIRERNSKRGLEALGINIMVVEDQEFTRKLMATYLNKEHSCALAEDAAQALTLYAKIVPDIVFLDVELPDANGHDLAALIKHHDPDSFVIMVTANNYAKDVQTAQKNKVQGYITKPFQQHKIQATIDAYIKRRSAKSA